MTAQAKADAMTAPEPTRGPFKLEQCLDLLLSAYRKGAYIYAFDAMNAYRDSCLHSTVDELRDRGIQFDQRRHGETRFQDYRLRPESVEAARKLRDSMRRKRGALPPVPVETKSAPDTPQDRAN